MFKIEKFKCAFLPPLRPRHYRNPGSLVKTAKDHWGFNQPIHTLFILTHRHRVLMTLYITTSRPNLHLFFSSPGSENWSNSIKLFLGMTKLTWIIPIYLPRAEKTRKTTTRLGIGRDGRGWPMGIKQLLYHSIPSIVDGCENMKGLGAKFCGAKMTLQWLSVCVCECEWVCVCLCVCLYVFMCNFRYMCNVCVVGLPFYSLSVYLLVCFAIQLEF